VLTDDCEHFTRCQVFEVRPGQVLVGAAAVLADVVLAFGKDAALHGLVEPGGFVLGQRVQVVQAAEEEEVGDLLHHLQGVGDAAGPEGVPDAVDLGFDCAGDHGVVLAGIRGRAGITSRRLFRGPGLSRRELDDFATFGGLPCAGRLDNLVDVEAGLSSDRVTDRVDLFDYWILADRGHFSSTNSTGVQMMGGSKPASRQMASILLRIVALAM